MQIGNVFHGWYSVMQKPLLFSSYGKYFCNSIAITSPFGMLYLLVAAEARCNKTNSVLAQRLIEGYTICRISLRKYGFVIYLCITKMLLPHQLNIE